MSESWAEVTTLLQICYPTVQQLAELIYHPHLLFPTPTPYAFPQQKVDLPSPISQKHHSHHILTQVFNPFANSYLPDSSISIPTSFILNLQNISYFIA